jgi:hypothetical protein
MAGAVLTAALALSSVGTTKSARAAADEEYVYESTFLRVEPATVKVCLREGADLKVTAVTSRRRFALSSPLGTVFEQPVSNVSIGAQSSDRNLGMMNPSSASTPSAQHNAATGETAASFHVITQDTPGTMTVLFTAPGYDPVTATVEVKQCEYDIYVKTEGEYPKGWKPHLIMQLHETVIPDQNGKFDVWTTLGSVGWWAVPWPFGHCSTKVTVASSQVHLIGEASSGVLQATVQYQNVVVEQTPGCSAPLLGRVEVDKVSSILPETIRISKVLQANRGEVWSEPQIVRTDGGDFTGEATISLTARPK